MEEAIKNEEKVSLYIFRKENDIKEIVSKNDIDIGKKYTIGRSKNKADIILDEKHVSRKHIEITFINSQQILVKDLDSSNGTFINGEQVSPFKEYHLNINDSLSIGGIMMNEISFEDLKKEEEKKIKESDEKNNLNEKNENEKNENENLKNNLNEKNENENEKNNLNENNKNENEKNENEKNENENNKNENEKNENENEKKDQENKNIVKIENKKPSDSKSKSINSYYKNNASPQRQYRRESSSRSRSPSRSRERSRDFSNRKRQRPYSQYNKNKNYNRASDSYGKADNIRSRHHSRDHNSNYSRSHSYSRRKNSSRGKNNKYKNIRSYVIKKEDNKEKVNEKDFKQMMLYKEYLQVKKETSLPKLLPVLISRKEDEDFTTNNNYFKVPISTEMTKFLKRGLQSTSKKSYYDTYYKNY